MNAEFNTIFGNPRPESHGLASYDVTGIDVDAVMQRYEFHRQRLVDLEVLAKLTATFPRLSFDGSAARSDARLDFTHRMWDAFPAHRHYHLDSDGTFSVWVPVSDAPSWKQFLDAEFSVAK
ncbi:hypothetical protein [Stieleria varia]|uniref:hypothetical protein n=1 Tax=Stieleria varia TaxID=2528005 RepID=UPI0011B66F5E|nr:hypothetical protein [Stieleria varia]